MPNPLTVPQAAEILGLSPQRVRALCAQGRIPARKIGRDWMIDEARVLPGNPPGNPNWKKKE